MKEENVLLVRELKEVALVKLSLLLRERITESKEHNTTVKICVFYKDGHSLEQCSLLDKKKTHNEKISFLRRNGICFGCL